MYWFLNVEYEDGGKSDTYTGLKISKGDVVKIFDSGDPIVDYIDLYREMVDCHILCSSSFDHFFMDQRRYVERYLKEVDGEYEFMSRDEVNALPWNDLKRCPTVIASSKMKSFKAVKRHYRKFKNISKNNSL